MATNDGGSDGGIAAGANGDDGDDADVDAAADGNGEGKMFFTTSDLIDRMNSAIRDANADDENENDGAGTGAGEGGFELQRKMPDGSYRRAEEGETAAADFQAKMRQASERIAGLDGPEKIEWAKDQRREGNALFAKGDYKEAMDVYLTCLVAMDQTSPAASSDEKKSAAEKGESNDGQSEKRLEMQIEEEIKLPVLLNLALSALKMGALSKAIKFCDFAMETECGRRSVKLHFRRGSARTLAGDYAAAASDLDRALELNAEMISEEDEDRGGGDDARESERERAAILREKRKLSRLAKRAERNGRRQRRAMERLFRSGENGNSTPNGANEEAETSLYPEMKCPKPISMPRGDGGDTSEGYRASCLGWYVRVIGRCAQRLLDVIGEGEDDDERATMLRRTPLEMAEDKKDA